MYEGALVDGGELLVGNILDGLVDLVGDSLHEQPVHDFLFVLSCHKTQGRCCSSCSLFAVFESGKKLHFKKEIEKNTNFLVET